MDGYGSAIKARRKYWGETQQVLASAIGVSGALISKIESGKQTLSLDVALRIASHYKVSVEHLVCGEYATETASSTLTGFTLDDAKKLLTDCFPVVATKDAMQNKEFAEAYGLHRRFVRDLLTAEGPQLSTKARCVNLYYDVWENSGLVEAAANLLGLTIMTGAQITDMDVEKAQEKLIKAKAFDGPMARNIYLGNQNNTIDRKTQKEAFVDGVWEEIVRFLAALKRSENLQPLGDFYLALCYFFGIMKGTLTPEECNRMGMNLLEVLAVLGNEYAIKFFEFAQI